MNLKLFRNFTAILLAIFFQFAAFDLLANSDTTAQSGILGDKSLVISSFTLDLAQAVPFDDYLSEQQFGGVMQDALNALLKAKGKLAKEEDSGAVKLDIYVDYYRRFDGDETPFAIPRLSSPLLRFTISATQDGKQLLNFKQLGLADFHVPYSFLFPPRQSERDKDISYAVAASLRIAQTLADNSPDFNLKHIEKSVDFPKLVSSLDLSYPLKSHGSISFDVPDAAVADYISKLNDRRADTRESTYNKISSYWLLNEKLIDLVRRNTDTLINNPTRDNQEELQFALRALASFGLKEDNSRFEQALQLPVKKKKVHEYFVREDRTHKKRCAQIYLMHDYSPEQLAMSWDMRQFTKRISVRDVFDNYTVLKILNVKYPLEESINKVMVSRLESETKKGNYLAQVYARDHANMCRNLAYSNNTEYMALFQKLGEHASSRYTRGWCKTAGVIMSDIEKKKLKKAKKKLAHKSGKGKKSHH